MDPLFKIDMLDEFRGHHSFDETPRSADYTLHVHEMPELYFFKDGLGSCYIEGTLYPLKPESLLILAAGESHHLHIEESHPYERICIQFSPALLRSADPSGIVDPLFVGRPWGSHNLYALEEMNADLIRSLYTSMSVLLHTEQDPSKQKLIFLSHLLPILYEMQRCGERPLSHKRPSSDTISQVVIYIQEHLSEELSLATLSKHFFISKTHLNNQFKKMTGETVGNYVRIKRLIQAKQAIVAGTPAGQAAFDCGFNDYSSFFRQYKAHFHESPTKSRPRS